MRYLLFRSSQVACVWLFLSPFLGWGFSCHNMWKLPSFWRPYMPLFWASSPVKPPVCVWETAVASHRHTAWLCLGRMFCGRNRDKIALWGPTDPVSCLFRDPAISVTTAYRREGEIALCLHLTSPYLPGTRRSGISSRTSPWGSRCADGLAELSPWLESRGSTETSCIVQKKAHLIKTVNGHILRLLKHYIIGKLAAFWWKCDSIHISSCTTWGFKMWGGGLSLAAQHFIISSRHAWIQNLP